MYQVISYLVDYYYNDLLLCFLNSSGGSTNSEGVLPVASLASDLDRRVSRIQGGQVTLILSCSHSASILSSDWLTASYSVSILSSDWLTASYSVPILSSDWFRTSDASDVSHCDPKFVWPQLHRQHAHVSPGTRRWHVPIMSVAAHEIVGGCEVLLTSCHSFQTGAQPKWNLSAYQLALCEGIGG